MDEPMTPSLDTFSKFENKSLVPDSQFKFRKATARTDFLMMPFTLSKNASSFFSRVIAVSMAASLKVIAYNDIQTERVR